MAEFRLLPAAELDEIEQWARTALDPNVLARQNLLRVTEAVRAEQHLIWKHHSASWIERQEAGPCTLCWELRAEGD